MNSELYKPLKVTGIKQRGFRGDAVYEVLSISVQGHWLDFRPCYQIANDKGQIVNVQCHKVKITQE